MNSDAGDLVEKAQSDFACVLQSFVETKDRGVFWASLKRIARQFVDSVDEELMKQVFDKVRDHGLNSMPLWLIARYPNVFEPFRNRSAQKLWKCMIIYAFEGTEYVRVVWSSSNPSKCYVCKKKKQMPLVLKVGTQEEIVCHHCGRIFLDGKIFFLRLIELAKCDSDVRYKLEVLDQLHSQIKVESTI